MRERPLSITILGWSWLVLALLNLTTAIIPDKVPTTNALGWSTGINQGYEVLIYGFTVLCCLPILRGKIWARNCFTAVLALELVRMALLDWADSKAFFHMEVLLSTLAVWALFRPLGRAFFHGEGTAPRYTWQSGTAFCYALTTFFMMLAMGMLSATALIGEKALYWTLLLTFFAAATYSAGNALGVVLNPKRDVGSILVFAAVLHLHFMIGAYINNAGGFEAALRGGNPDPNVNLWIASAVTVVFVTVGVSLIRRSRLAGKVFPAETLENTEDAGNL